MPSSELLLSSIFSVTKVSDPLLESYIIFATTGANTLLDSTNTNNSIISLETFVPQLLKFGPFTVNRNPYQWSFLLRLLPVLLSTAVSTDTIVSNLQQGNPNLAWVDILSDLFCLLSHIVAVGLYPDNTQSPENSPVTLTSALSFHTNTQGGFDSQFSLASQPSISGMDLDATLDMDNTQRMDEDIKEEISIPHRGSVTDEERRKSKRWIEAENAAAAAQIMIHLIEKKGAKRIFEVRNNLRRQAGLATANHGKRKQRGVSSRNTDFLIEPWYSCQHKLMPSDPFIKNNASTHVSQNAHVQKLLTLVQRLADRDSERRMAVHMKYHELEDEGTARAMPSAGIMGFLYHMVTS